jgi:LuxR family maltose regulon positive regulatory protein
MVPRTVLVEQLLASQAAPFVCVVAPAGYGKTTVLAQWAERKGRLSGPLCDAILDTRGSGRVLSSLEDSNLLLVPLDRRWQWYRYHHLFRELLQAELERREPELLPSLHTRAATWYEANGLAELAIDHAYAAGRVDTARRWLAWFDDQGLVEHHPPVAVLGAWIQALVGRPVDAERWADAAERGSGSGTLPDGSTMESNRAMLRGLLSRNGLGQMRADAQAAMAGLSPASPWRATALLFEGVADFLDGQPDQADPILAHAVQIGTNTGALPAASTALAERCVVAMERQQWSEATTLADQALAMLQSGRLDDYFMSPLVHTVAARTALHRGDVRRAQEHLVQAARLRPLLTYATPSVTVQTLLELGRAYLALDDAAGARTVLRQARGILQRRPDLGVLPDQAGELQAKLDTPAERSQGCRRSPRPSCGCSRCWRRTCISSRSGSGSASPSTRSRPRRSLSTASLACPHAARRSSGSKRSASSRGRPGPTLAGSSPSGG